MNNKIKREEAIAIKITKLSDDTFEGNHPNNVYAGTVSEGFVTKMPEIGERYSVGSFLTSMVTQTLDKDSVFKTLYSTYKLEILKNKL
jgi:hypothetical protein